MSAPSHAESSSQDLSYMLTMPIPRLVAKMAIPTVITMLVTSVYGIADMFFVSELGTSASAAVGIVFSIMTTIQALGFMLGMGAGSLISRKLGEGKLKEAESLATVAFFSSLVGGLVLLIVGLQLKTALMKVLGATATILPYAEEFAHYILIAAPIMCGAFVLNILLRSQGKAKLSMIGLSTGGILNIILEPIFIFKLKMGIGGAAVATCISQAVSFVLLLSIYLSHKELARISLRLLPTALPRFFPKICASGGASLLRQSLVVVANVLLNIHASAYGDAAVAGISITSRVFLVVISVMFGIGQGFQPVAGFCFGAKQFERVRKSYYFTLFISTLIQILFAVLLFFFARHTVQLFQKAQEVVQVGTRAIRFYALSLPFLPLSVVTNMLLQVTGKNKQSIFLSSCRQGIFFLPLIFILPRSFGITGLELSQPLANLLSGLIAIPFLVQARFTYQDKTY
jgi:putative MATE family efflux protein